MRNLTLTLVLIMAGGLGAAANVAHASSVSHKKRTAAAKSSHSSRRARAGKKSDRVRGQKAPASERISEIQQALSKDGSFEGTPNGKWDGATIEAMKKFQASHGLNPSGKLDAKSLEQLGLGSKTAGLAAPMPSTTPSRLSKLTPAPTQTAQRRQ